ncbi:MAG: FGGY family carbohydrate kinase [Candidatus Atabeyarchaeum deiterrae]
MSGGYLLSVDSGTTATKVALFNDKGELQAISTHEYKLITPSALAVEIDADTLWNAFKAGVAEVVKKTKTNTKDIAAIGISAQGETLILLDRNGKPLRRAISWMDNRAQGEAEKLDKEFDDGTSYRITGQVKLVPTWPASKILWIKRNEPDLYKKVYKYLLVEDYLIYKMTSNFACEGSLICSTCYWNIITEKWWDEMLECLGISLEQLPEIKLSGEAVGELTREAASELGLTTKTVVSMGALDQACGAIGVGNTRQGMFSENTGAALAICAPVEEPIFDEERRMPVHYFAIPHRYMEHTFTTGGMVLRWYRDTFCQPEIAAASLSKVDPYDTIGDEAEQVPPGCEGLVMLPHLQGAMAPEANQKAKGVFYGFTLKHTKAHFARAIMEAIACIVRRNIDVIEDLGTKVNEIRALGGGARSRVWKQIEADITKRPVVTTKNEEAACLGAAILAGKAIGLYHNIEQASENMVAIKERFEPNYRNFSIYDHSYEKYVKLYSDLCDLFSKEE